MTKLFKFIFALLIVESVSILLRPNLSGQDLIIPEPALQNAIARSLGVNEHSLSRSLVVKTNDWREMILVLEI